MTPTLYRIAMVVLAACAIVAPAAAQSPPPPPPPPGEPQSVLVLGRISDDPKQHYEALRPLLDYVVPRMRGGGAGN